MNIDVNKFNIIENKVVFPGEYVYTKVNRDFDVKSKEEETTLLSHRNLQLKEDNYYSTVYGKIRYNEKMNLIYVQNHFLEVKKDDKKSINLSLLNNFPQVGSIIYGKVINIGIESVKLLIMVVDNIPLLFNRSFYGIIRKNDISSELPYDKIQILKYYQPGDIVKAVILNSLGLTLFNLSTNKDDLGVVFSKIKIIVPNEEESSLSERKEEEERLHTERLKEIEKQKLLEIERQEQEKKLKIMNLQKIQEEEDKNLEEGEIKADDILNRKI